uniref:Sphingosine-1-phosphate lyase 1 n=1 Tax=Callithrix jacchus TaxID=9483 RepID=A0A8I3X1N4_CALJA
EPRDSLRPRLQVCGFSELEGATSFMPQRHVGEYNRELGIRTAVAAQGEKQLHHPRWWSSFSACRATLVMNPKAYLSEVRGNLISFIEEALVNLT